MEVILVVDDEQGVRQSFYMILKDHYRVISAETGAEALEILAQRSVDLVLLDIMLPDMSGIDILERLKASEPDTEVIMVTAVNDVQTAVKAIKLGAYDYIIKPFVVGDIVALIRRAMEKSHLVREVAYLKSELQRHYSFEKMVGQDPKIVAIYNLIDSIAQGDGTALIQGESGTGKELVARAIHNRSKRSHGPFVVISCAAIPDTLAEGVLFGHERGAFTGATESKRGKLEIAHNGTVFLDDIDCLNVNTQAKLLRIIQEREFERLGSTRVIRVDVRFVAASNKNLDELIQNNAFREDLYYRLNVFPVVLPPLRQRQGDIPLLLDHFLQHQAQRTGKPLKRFAKRALNLICAYDWPGNVRELENLVERLCTIVPSEVIDVNDVANYAVPKKMISDLPLKDALQLFEKQYITDVLQDVDGNRKKAAAKLGIHRNTLQNKLKELDLTIQ